MMNKDKFSYHEIIHVCHIINSMIDDYLDDHPASNAEMHKHFWRAQKEILQAIELATKKKERALVGPLQVLKRPKATLTQT